MASSMGQQFTVTFGRLVFSVRPSELELRGFDSFQPTAELITLRTIVAPYYEGIFMKRGNCTEYSHVLGS